VSAWWINALLILLAGVPVTFVTTWRDPWISLAAMLVVAVAFVAASFAVFHSRSLNVDPVGPFLAAFLSWTFVTLYRQLTEERQKRAFSLSLAQYTSPAIANKLAETLTQKAGSLDLSPQAREVTCFFSDLKGFTSISERLGASRTREVLNPYLEAMSTVLIEHNAMINKFMGDGIFAFFNPPILPVANHARAACEAALDSFVALEELKQRLGHGELKEEVMAFRMRVGVNSGEVFVGDYGSSNKLDYTCIGDTVNLSARLEPACKPFGIYAMISESTLQQAGDGYVVRHLGGLQVVGKKQAVHVYELIGRKGEVNGGEVEYAELFGEAVKWFQQRDWERALTTLGECRKARAKDLAVELLEFNIRTHQETPPPADWNQAIELTSK
jgi:adenylate cyclase